VFEKKTKFKGNIGIGLFMLGHLVPGIKVMVLLVLSHQR
jgi:hypothetical protein